MRRTFLVLVAVFVALYCPKSDAYGSPNFEGKWANVKDFREQLEITKNGSSYLVTITTPDKFFGGSPQSKKIAAVLDKDLMKIEDIIRLTLAIDSQTGLLITPDGQFRRLTGNAEDKELRGCWESKSTTIHFADHVEKSASQGCSIFYDGQYSTSSCSGKNGSRTVVTSYQFLRPGVLETAIEKNSGNPASIGSIHQVSYSIRSGELLITTQPKENSITNPKRALKFESTSKFLTGVSKAECIKKI